MPKGLTQSLIGGLEIAAGVAAIVLTGGAAAPLAASLIIAGTGQLIAGIGTMLSNKGPIKGPSTTERNPVAPWEVLYGQRRVGGTIVYLHQWGDTNKFMDLVIVVAAHACESIDALYFNNLRVQIDTTTAPSGSLAGTGSSFAPLNGGRTPVNISSISRGAAPYNGVVTVTLDGDIPLLEDGDYISITDQNNGGVLDSYGATGKFPASIVDRTGGNLTFYYLCGGVEFLVNNEGQAVSNFANYYRSVYFEPLLGNQTLGQTFQGMLQGTIMGGVGGSPAGSDEAKYLYQYNDSTTNNVNPWTANCSLVGKTAFFLRLLYTPLNYPGDIPEISALVSGKNDIYDPRSSPPSYGYSTNSALCIADFLNQGDLTDGRNRPAWGFGAAYGTDIPTPELIAAANISDEQVGVAIPYTSPLTTESRYTLNGHFDLSQKRGDILKNLLTSCAGRITDSTPFILYPAAWPGVSLTWTSAQMDTYAAGRRTWKPTVSISELYNGVRGTFVSPDNQWKPTDFPPYAQDALHGYNDGPADDEYDLNLAEDGGVRRWLNIQLPFTTSAATAQRIAKIELLRRRQMGTGTFMLNMTGYQIAPADVLALSLDYLGWDGQYLEILATRLKFDKVPLEGGTDVVLLGTEIDVQETDPSVYDWELIEQLSPQGYPQSGIPDGVATPDPPTNLKFSFDESGYPILTWTPPLDPYVQHIKGRYMLVASPPGLWIQLGTVDVSITQLTMPALLPGQTYLVELASVNAAGVLSTWAPINYTPLSIPPQWLPYYVQASPDDALYPNEWTFAIALSYLNLLGAQNALADGTQLARVNVTGNQPITQVLPTCPTPIITGWTISASGGYLRGGITLYVSVTADDAGSPPNFSPPAGIVAIAIPAGSNANSIELEVTWPDYSGFEHYNIFASEQVDLLCRQIGGSLTPGVPSPPLSPPDVGYSPATVELAGVSSSPVEDGLLRSTWGLPDPKLRKIRHKACVCYHGGILGAGVTSVSGNTLISDDCLRPGSSDDFTGRPLILIGRDNTTTFPAEMVPFGAYRILGYNPSTGTFTLDRPMVSSPPNANDPQPGDAFVVGTLGYDNSADPYQLHDAGWDNQVEDDDMGLTPTVEAEMIAWVIAGPGRGSKAIVATNDATTHYLKSALPIGVGSVWIIVEDGYPYSADSNTLTAGYPGRSSTTVVPVSNFYRQSMLSVPVLVDISGQESEIGDGQVRMFYTYGTLIQNFALATFGIDDSTVADDVTLHIPVKIPGSAAYDATVQIKASPSADTNININLVTPGSPPTSASIFSGGYITIPAGSTGQLVFSSFTSDALAFALGQYFTFDVLSGDADGTFSVVLKWVIQQGS